MGELACMASGQGSWQRFLQRLAGFDPSPGLIVAAERASISQRGGGFAGGPQGGPEQGAVAVQRRVVPPKGQENPAPHYVLAGHKHPEAHDSCGQDGHWHPPSTPLKRLSCKHIL